jgi:hypothetical protein
VHIDQRRQLGRRIGWHIALQGDKLGRHRIARVAQAGDLGIDPIRRDEIMRHIDTTRGYQHRATDGHAA